MFGKKDSKKNLKLIAELQEEIRFLKERIEAVNAAERSASVLIDFDKMNVFSIERIPAGERPAYTVLGYVFDNGTSHELRQWYLHINYETHEDLVKKYLEHASTKVPPAPR